MGVWVGVWGIMIEANSLCTICFNYLSRITVKLKSLKELIAKVKFKIYVHKMSNSTLICYFLSWLALGIVYNTFFCLLI